MLAALNRRGPFGDETRTAVGSVLIRWTSVEEGELVVITITKVEEIEATRAHVIEGGMA